MKKTIGWILTLLTLTALCACGAPAAPEADPAQPTATARPQDTTQPEAPTETAAPQETERPTETAAPTEEADPLFTAAEACIDQPVSVLYEAIGYPESSDYAPSCLEVGGEDGNLYYDGFTVYTLRTAEGRP